jgi:hypothetical protein
MSEQIYINDLLIEMPDKPVVALTSQINDLSELKDHQSTLSYTIKAPATASNLKTIENADRIESNTVIPYRKNRARVVKNGVDVVKNGFAEIRSIDKTINFVVYEGNVDFFALIEGKSLRDLDLSALDHLFNFANITGSFTNDSTDGYKYSLIDYGQLDDTNREIHPKDLRATVFYAYLFEQIILQAGLTFDGNIFSNAKFKKIILTTEDDNKGIYFDLNGSISEGESEIYQDPVVPYPRDYLSSFLRPAGELWTYSMTITFTITAWANGVSSFTITSRYMWQAQYNYIHSDADGAGTFTKTFTWDSSIYLSTVDIQDTIIYEATNIIVKVDFGELSGYVSGETEPQFFIHLLPIPIQTIGLGVTGFGNFGMDLKNQYDYTEINLSNTLPDITQTDLVKAIANIFHLIFYTNKTENKIYIKQFSEIVDDIGNAEDWSSKLHMDESTQLKEFRIGGYSKKNYCTYTEDDSDIKKPLKFGNGLITIADETLPKEQTLFELPFSSSIMVSKLVGLIMPRVNRTDADGELTIDTVPRLLIDDTGAILDTVGDLVVNDGVSSVSLATDIPFCYFINKSKEFNLGFDNSLLRDNYAALTTVLNKTKKIVASFKLSALDFYNLDHFKPIYLNKFSAYFYVNKVLNWTGEGLTKVELIRIGERNNALIVPTRRCTLLESAEYRLINGMWPAGDHIFTLESLTINGLSYTAGQTFTVNAPSGLLVGLGLDGITNYIMNISDWMNSILPDDFEAHDDLTTIDHPEGSTFEFEIKYEDISTGATWTNYKYNNLGFYFPGAADPVATFICETL